MTSARSVIVSQASSNKVNGAAYALTSALQAAVLNIGDNLDKGLEELAPLLENTTVKRGRGLGVRVKGRVHVDGDSSLAYEDTPVMYGNSVFQPFEQKMLIVQPSHKPQVIQPQPAPAPAMKYVQMLINKVPVETTSKVPQVPLVMNVAEPFIYNSVPQKISTAARRNHVFDIDGFLNVSDDFDRTALETQLFKNGVSEKHSYVNDQMQKFAGRVEAFNAVYPKELAQWAIGKLVRKNGATFSNVLQGEEEVVKRVVQMIENGELLQPDRATPQEIDRWMTIRNLVDTNVEAAPTTEGQEAPAATNQVQSQIPFFGRTRPMLYRSRRYSTSDSTSDSNSSSDASSSSSSSL